MTRNWSNQNPSPTLKTNKITEITNSQNTKTTYGQPSEQIFPKRWPLSNQNLTKNNTNKHKVKRHQTLTPKQATENFNRTTAMEWSVMNYWRGA